MSGQPFDRYLVNHVLEPLGMEHTDLLRSERVRPHLATGYVLRSRGLRPVVDYEVPTPGGGGVYSTTADMACYVAALQRMGANEHGSVLRPDTLASVYQPHFQPDPRVPGMGLGFELGEEGGHKAIGKTGILSGFLSAMVLAPDDGIGVVVLVNAGGLSGRGAADPLASALLRRLLGLPDQAAVARTTDAAGAIGQLLLYPLLFFAGLWLPQERMGLVLGQISQLTPLGASVHALQSSMLGTFPSAESLLILVGYALLFGYLAVRFFR